MQISPLLTRPRVHGTYKGLMKGNIKIFSTRRLCRCTASVDDQWAEKVLVEERLKMSVPELDWVCTGCVIFSGWWYMDTPGAEMQLPIYLIISSSILAALRYFIYSLESSLFFIFLFLKNDSTLLRLIRQKLTQVLFIYLIRKFGTPGVYVLLLVGCTASYLSTNSCLHKKNKVNYICWRKISLVPINPRKHVGWNSGARMLDPVQVC